jgi:hypothetical protein
MSLKKKQTAAVLALGVFAVVADVAAVGGAPEAAMPGTEVAAPVGVVVERVASGALTAPVRLTGEVLAMRRARIRAETDGRVLVMPLRLGDGAGENKARSSRPITRFRSTTARGALPQYGNGRTASQTRQSRKPIADDEQLLGRRIEVPDKRVRELDWIGKRLPS